MFLILALVSFIYLSIWGFHNDNLRAVTISFIFISMILSAIAISRDKIFDMASTWGQSCFWFTVGFFFYMTLTFITTGRSSYSIFQLQGNELFASISGSLPIFWEFFINAVTIPIAEEMLWLFGLPIVLFWMLDKIGGVYKVSNQGWFKILSIFIVILVGGITFAIFHVGKFFIAFIISAIIFRTINTIMVWGEDKENIIPYISIVPAFAIGTHMGNNWSGVGFFKGLNIMITAEGYLSLFGWFFVIFLFIIFASAIGYLVEYFSSNKKGVDL